MSWKVNLIIGALASTNRCLSATHAIIAAVVFLGLSVCSASSQPASNLPTSVGNPVFNVCDNPPLSGLPALPYVAPQDTSATQWICAPPYQTPVYSPPGDDSIVLESLIEAAGVALSPGQGRVDTLSPFTAGYFCGDSARSIFAVRDVLSAAGKPPHVTLFAETLTLLEGPTPHVVASNLPIDASSEPGERWRSAASGNLDPRQPYDYVVLLRHVMTPDRPDLVIMQIPNEPLSSEPNQPIKALTIGPGLPRRCGTTPIVLASKQIGGVANSDWVAAAVGNFNGSGKKQIALLRTGHPNLVLVDLDKATTGGYTLNVVESQDLDPKHTFAWKGLTAGDVEGTGFDELVAVRQVGDHQSPTVLAFKWNGSAFIQTVSSNFGNDNTSNWVGAAAADFNADHRAAVILLRDTDPAFSVLSFRSAGPIQETIRSSKLNTAPGQPWSGIAVTDWIGGDQGSNELIAIRNVTSPFRTNVFVYGDPFHLALRNSALAETKAQYDQLAVLSGCQMDSSKIDELKQIMRATRTNTFVWQLAQRQDYTNLVKFLIATRNFGVWGQQVRVWANLIHPSAVNVDPNAFQASMPEDTSETVADSCLSKLTTWNALDYFVNDPDDSSKAKDMVAWSKVLGRLAQDFPHLVGVDIDDFSLSLAFEGGGDFGPELIANMEASLRSQAPWMSLVPTTYWPLFTYNGGKRPWADIGLTLDSMLFYFRDEKQYAKQNTTPCAAAQCLMPDGMTRPHPQACLAGINVKFGAGLPCAEATIPNAPGEFSDMASLLPEDRKLIGGVYFSGHSEYGTPTAKYDYELSKLILKQPSVSGVLVYTLQPPTAPGPCTDTPTSFENNSNKYCTVWGVFALP